MVKKLDIEALLGRPEIRIEDPKTEAMHEGKTILVTGGVGSIGGELVRQLCRFNIGKLVVLDQAETALYEAQLELETLFPKIDKIFILADVSDRERMEQIFETHHFDIIYHAAAYKHVPVMEHHPSEGVRVNILGTKILAELAQNYAVKRFVMISTDKAVNPKSIMGATKRVAELLVQNLQQKEGNPTDFIITRFGNVLGSNGSVIFRFQKQLAQNLPITITHPDASRYFMSIGEACQLVLQAGAMGNGGEIGVFNMGNPIKIVDLAQKISFLHQGKEAEIIFTGLREGDKITEELWTEDTEILPYSNEKIVWCREQKIEISEEKVAQLFCIRDKEEIKSQLSEILHNFIITNEL